MMFTSFNNGHRHSWKEKNVFTSVRAGHKHKFNIKRGLALPGGKDGHSHKLRGRR